MIAAKVHTERLASRADFVDSTRCISTWSLGKVNTTSKNTRKMKPQTVAWVRSKLKSNSLVLSSDRAAVIA